MPHSIRRGLPHAFALCACLAVACCTGPGIATASASAAPAADDDALRLAGPLAALERIGPVYRDERPDVVQIYLLDAEDPAWRAAGGTFRGRRGLDASLVAPMVRRAHDAGLRVSARIETACDFHVAVEADVDEIDPLPGDGADSGRALSRYPIDPADARLAAVRGITVVTTVNEILESLGGGSGTLLHAGANDLLARNLRLLSEAGVKLTIGRGPAAGAHVAGGPAA